MKKVIFALLLISLLVGVGSPGASYPSLAAPPRVNYLVNGIVSGALGPLTGVTVSAGPGNPSTQTDANGYYQLSLPAGTYTVTTVITSFCYTPGLVIVTLPPSQRVDFQLPTRQVGGYLCDDLFRRSYIAATIPITNFTDLDNGTAAVTLPFDFTYFSVTYPGGSTINISTNGNLQFTGADPSPWNQHIPNPAPPNNAIYAFGADLTLAGGDARPLRPKGRGVYAVETSGLRANTNAYVIEWRDVGVVSGGTANFEVVLEQGSNNIYVNYRSIAVLSSQLYSVEGVENGNGSVALEYSYLRGLLNNLLSNTTVTYYPATSIAASPTPCSMPFTDLAGSLFLGAIQYLYCGGVVNGTDPTHYSPGASSTRAQFAKVVALGFGLNPYTPPGQPDFSDVSARNFAYQYIEAGYHAGILQGFDQHSCQDHGATFPCYLPGIPITRGQLTSLVVGAAHYPLYTPTTSQDFVDVSSNNIFYAAIETAAHKGVVVGYPDRTFRPNNNIRRDEMAQIVYKGVTTP